MYYISFVTLRIIPWQATSETEQAAGEPEQAADLQPKSMTRPKVWSEEVEEAYRFQLAGYRDEKEYVSVKQIEVLHDCIVIRI